jgi:DNA-binding transcriptional LysR family regulator
MNGTIEIRAVELFVRVAELRSFRAAGDALGVPRSTVSRRVAELESALGTRLFHRTTRHVELTSAGKTYFRACGPALGAIMEAGRAIATTSEDTAGRLRVTAPVTLAERLLGEVVAECLARHPQMRLELVLTDRHVDLVGEKFDLVRGGARARTRTTALLCEPRIPTRLWNAPYTTRPPPTRVHPLHAARATRSLDVPLSWSCPGGSGARTARRQQHPARVRGRSPRARHCPTSRSDRRRRACSQSTRRDPQRVRAARAALLCSSCQRRSRLTRCASVPRDREEASGPNWREGTCDNPREFHLAVTESVCDAHTYDVPATHRPLTHLRRPLQTRSAVPVFRTWGISRSSAATRDSCRPITSACNLA